MAAGLAAFLVAGLAAFLAAGLAAFLAAFLTIGLAGRAFLLAAAAFDLAAAAFLAAAAAFFASAAIFLARAFARASSCLAHCLPTFWLAMAIALIFPAATLMPESASLALFSSLCSSERAWLAV